MGVGLAPAGGLGGNRLGLVFKLPVETLLLACGVLVCASPLKLASSLEEEKEELVERLAGAAGLSPEETLASGVSVLEVLVAVGVWTVGSEELLGTEASSASPSTLAELSELMLSRLRAGDGVEDDGSECDSLEIGWWAAKQRENSGRKGVGGSQERRGEWYTLGAVTSAKGTSVCLSSERTDGTLQRKGLACKNVTLQWVERTWLTQVPAQPSLHKDLACQGDGEASWEGGTSKGLHRVYGGEVRGCREAHLVEKHWGLVELAASLPLGCWWG